jgi:hypothetical protein
VLTVAFLVASSGAAYAQEEPSAADTSAARALGQEGVRLADAGNCAEAIDKLQKADKIFHAPTLQGRLGECQVQLGKLVEGTENLNKVVREQLGPNAPQAFRDAQERAKRILDAAKPRIAKLKIAVAAPPDAQMTVKVDGENMPLANLNVSRPVDPGEHAIEVTAPGFLPASAKVRLADGGNDSVALTLEADPNAPKVAALPPGGGQGGPPGGNQPPPDHGQGSSKVPAYAAFGVGVVGLGIGTIFGIIASGKKSDLDTGCTNKTCPESQRSTLDSAKSNATISTVGFVIGGVGIAAGAVLYILASGSSSASTGQAKLTFTGDGVSGRF